MRCCSRNSKPRSSRDFAVRIEYRGAGRCLARSGQDRSSPAYSRFLAQLPLRPDIESLKTAANLGTAGGRHARPCFRLCPSAEQGVMTVSQNASPLPISELDSHVASLRIGHLTELSPPHGSSDLPAQPARPDEHQIRAQLERIIAS